MRVAIRLYDGVKLICVLPDSVKYKTTNEIVFDISSSVVLDKND